MEFAIVRFTSEEDAPGIISTRWIDDENSCWFPNVRTEDAKNKMLITHSSPQKDWMKCPIRILRKFPNYQSARIHLRKAEDTSNLDSEVEYNKPRKRIKKKIRLPNEDTTSEDEITVPHSKESFSSPPYHNLLSSTPTIIHYPQPPTASNSFCSDSEESASILQQCSPSTNRSCSKIQSVNKKIDTLLKAHQHKCQPPTASSSLFSDSEESANTLQLDPSAHLAGASSDIQVVNKKLDELLKAQQHTYQPSTASNSLFFDGEGSSSIVQQLDPSTRLTGASFDIQGLNKKLATLFKTQTHMCQVMGEMFDAFKRLENKIDSLLSKQNSQDIYPKEKTITVEEDEDLKLISSLPLGCKEFEILDKRIAKRNYLRKRLINIFMTVGGREAKIIVGNILRKIMLDEVAETYSLTGKSTKIGFEKRSFEKTEIYKLILETCTRIQKDVKVSFLRETISDYLMQSKFRRIRKEQRRKAKDLLSVPEIYCNT